MTLNLKFNSKIDNEQCTLSSIQALYVFGAIISSKEMQKKASTSFCKLFDILNPAEFTAMGIYLSHGA
tara:strand:+ start:2182 stop:2385 length:204 start_codon:yes stop_codon:yes gene_type:complete